MNAPDDIGVVLIDRFGCQGQRGDVKQRLSEGSGSRRREGQGEPGQKGWAVTSDGKMKGMDFEDGRAEVMIEVWVVSQLYDTLPDLGVVWITAGQGVGEWRKGQSRRCS
jgi:hypothetical protein